MTGTKKVQISGTKGIFPPANTSVCLVYMNKGEMKCLKVLVEGAECASRGKLFHMRMESRTKEEWKEFVCAHGWCNKCDESAWRLLTLWTKISGG